MKKLASIFLTGVLCLSLTTSAFAWGDSGGGHSGGGSSSSSGSGWSGGGSNGGYNQGTDNHNNNSDWDDNMQMGGGSNWGNNSQMQPGQHMNDNNINFRDMGDAKWAASYITKMQDKNIVKGYPDGSFKPNQPVSRVEAISMIARSQNASQATGQNAYADAPAWAKNHINWAVSNELLTPGIDGNKLLPEKPATRLWMAQMAVRMLGLEDQAAVAQVTYLPFADSSSIPANMKGYVDVAMDNGIFAGYPDQTFQPNKPITRAEMCVILNRCVNQMMNGMMNGTMINNLNNENIGSLVSVANGSVTVAVYGGGSTTLAVDANATVWVNNAPATINDLKPGDVVEVTLNASGSVIMIDAVNNQQAAVTAQSATTTTTTAPTSTTNTTTTTTTTPTTTPTP